MKHHHHHHHHPRYRWHPPAWWKHEALCVHHYEGSWTALNPAGPYYGGFQADYSFMAAYGRWPLRHYGDARHWTPHAQLHMAWRGWKARGWSPWPQTAARCGLL